MKTRSNSLRSILLVSLALVAFAVGCDGRKLQPVDPCQLYTFQGKASQNNIEKVDLLFMVDNSNSMEQEQANLAGELNRMVSILASGDIDGDGAEDFPGVRSLRVGVISSDMGATNISGGGCGVGGDDGILQTRGNTAISGCQAEYPQFFDFTRGEDSVVFAKSASCVSSLGLGGCGLEQQLESLLKSLTPSSSPIRFAGNTTGHGDGANAGFLREDAALAIINVTDENDCSYKPEYAGLSDSTDTSFDPELNLRCARHPEALHDVSRYVEGLVALKANPNQIIFASITGVPTDLIDTEATYDEILADDRMQEIADPADPQFLRPACQVRRCDNCELEDASPGRRFVELARALDQVGVSTSVHSTCAPTFTSAIDGIISDIFTLSPCLTRPLNRNSENRVDCTVLEKLPMGMTCSMVSELGREVDPVRMEGGREVCRVNQLPSVGEVIESPARGWYYDDFNDTDVCDQRTVFVEGSEPINGSVVFFDCVQNTSQSVGEVEGAGCLTDADCTTDQGNLACDSKDRICRPSCDSDASCSGSFVCADIHEEGRSYCFNPTCG